MPHAILFQSGFTGVDLKSNPLIIGERRKLRFATNIIFDEGVVRTRYGYRYEPLADAGQFQGACEFTPSQGISSSSFSDIQSGIALMVAGNLWFNGVLVGEGIYETTNNVNLYGAENYLIIQNLSGDTFWWDGDTFTRSPGMNEADFNDPETPTIEVDLDAPVLTLEPCVDDPCALTGDGIIFHVVDSSTEASIEGAAVSVTFKDSVAYSGATGADGRVSFDMVSRTYRHQGSADGYVTSSLIPFSVIEGEGQLITIRLNPSPDECDFTLELTPWTLDPETGNYHAGFTNTGPVPVTIQGVVSNTVGSSVVLIIPDPTVTLYPSESMAYIIEPGIEPFDGATIETTCGDHIHAADEEGGGSGECDFTVTFGPWEREGPSVDLAIRSSFTNVGPDSIVVTGIVGSGDLISTSPALPATINPTETLEYVISASLEESPSVVIITTCGVIEDTGCDFTLTSTGWSEEDLNGRTGGWVNDGPDAVVVTGYTVVNPLDVMVFSGTPYSDSPPFIPNDGEGGGYHVDGEGEDTGTYDIIVHTTCGDFLHTLAGGTLEPYEP